MLSKLDDGVNRVFDVSLEEAIEMGFAESVIKEAYAKQAIELVNLRHAQFMRQLTGGATVEERDTWKPKEEAARAYIAGTATNVQKRMIEKEASGDDTNPQELAQVIIDKSEPFYDLIGEASSLRRKAKAAIRAATSEDQEISGIEAQINAILTQMNAEAQVAAADWLSS